MRDSNQPVSSDHNHLLEAFINICNEALKNNQNHFPFCTIWKAVKNKCHNQAINIALVDDTPNPLCSLSITENGIIKKPIKNQKASQNCHIKLSHIKQVLENKEDYIKNPAKIDWHWIEAMLVNSSYDKSEQG